MYNSFQIGEKVIFQGLTDLPLFVEGINEINGGIRCKYFDDNLKTYIKLTLPAESLVLHKNAASHKKIHK